MSQTTRSCNRCLQLRKTCLPRKTPVPRCTTPESTAPIREVIPIQTGPKIRTDSAAVHQADVDDSAPRFNITLPEHRLDLLRPMDIDNLNATGSDDEFVEAKRSLPELMGYDPKKQRAEYMASRRSAKEAAYPLLLDKAWTRYSQLERDGAVDRVFRAFNARYCTYT